MQTLQTTLKLGFLLLFLSACKDPDSAPQESALPLPPKAAELSLLEVSSPPGFESLIHSWEGLIGTAAKDGALLYRLQSPTGFYEAIEKPDFLLRFSSRPSTLRVADFEAWMQESAAQGLAINVLLEHRARPLWNSFSPMENELRNLQLLLSKARPPQHLEAEPQGPPDNADAPKLNGIAKVFFYVRHNFPKDSLPADLCGYISKWVHAQQLLNGRDPQKSRSMSLDCVLYLATEKSPYNWSLNISSLPLPFIFQDEDRFPFVKIPDLTDAEALKKASRTL